MTFTMSILAREITAAIAACAQIVDSHSQIPILRCTRIAIADGMASFTATNTDQSVVAKAACDGAGIICVDTAALSAKVQTLKPDAVISFVGDGKSVTITQGRTRWIIPLLNPDDFPFAQVASQLDGEPIEMDAATIASLAVARGAVLPGAPSNYAGVWIDGGHIVAVDGRQMRILKGIDGPSCVLPHVAIDKIVAMFKDDGARVRVSESAAQFTSATLLLKTKLMEAKPSDWRAGLTRFDSQSVNVCTVDAELFMQACKRAAAIQASGEKAGSFINMQVKFRDDRIDILTRNREGEEGNDAVECMGGANSDVGVNGGLLIAALDTLSGRIEVRYGVPRDAVIMRDASGSVRVVFPRIFS